MDNVVYYKDLLAELKNRELLGYYIPLKTQRAIAKLHEWYVNEINRNIY